MEGFALQKPDGTLWFEQDGDAAFVAVFQNLEQVTEYQVRKQREHQLSPTAGFVPVSVTVTIGG